MAQNYVDDPYDLRVDNETTPDEVLRYLEHRTRNPAVIDGVTIFNYGTHTLNEEKLRERVEKLYRDTYMIPFQLGPVWAFMLYHLPKEVQTAEYLIYDSRDDEYYPHRNFMRLFEEGNYMEIDTLLDRWVDNNTDHTGEFRVRSDKPGLELYL